MADGSHRSPAPATDSQASVGRVLRRALLVVNPASRRGRRACPRAVRALEAAGVSCTVLATERPGHARILAIEHAATHDVVCAVGGDGTIMEIVSALAPDGPPVAIIPAGTGNLLARALGVPLSPARAARGILSSVEARIDLGRLADGTRIAIGAGVGIDAAMIATTSSTWKRRIGVIAYVVTGARHALVRRRFAAVITVDGVTVRREASSVLVANFGALLNGLITLGDGIRYDDGVLDVCIFDPRTTLDALRIALRLLTGRAGADPAMTYLRGREIVVTTEPTLPAQADGELIGETPFTVSVEPLAARLLIPHSEPNHRTVS